jgi:hypothetical protein
MTKITSNYLKKTSPSLHNPEAGSSSESSPPEGTATQELKPAMRKNSAPIRLSIEKRALIPEDIHLVYGIKKTTLANLRSERSGPRYCRIDGNTVVYFPRDVEKWLKKNMVLPKKESE